MSCNKIGIAGIGAIGSRVAKALDQGEIHGAALAGISARNDTRAEELNLHLSKPVPNYALSEIANHCDIVIEALPPTQFAGLAVAVLQAGKTLVVLSASQLLGRQDLIDLAKETGARIIVPSGAILGLDALKAAAEGAITSVVVETRKPVAGLIKAPYVMDMGLDLHALSEPLLVLEGSVTEVARAFPANVNVAAAISLAGLGPAKTRMEVWADPSLDRNLHSVRVTSDSSDFKMSIQNRPTPENPATGRITALSVIAWLRAQTAVLQVGT